MTQFSAKEEFYSHINKPVDTQVFAILNTLQEFYNWQGYNGNPAKGTVNQILGFSTDNPNRTYRYTYPHPHPSASFDIDQYGMPENIIGDDLRVCYAIDWKCPINNIPATLLEFSEVRAQGWFLPEEI
ncbi:MAG: hypothetical protein HWN81_14970 [Candidatus Lokiarchaeota archaeon]|nr:hypothetical protein [Candidatus Lokiarchaeota archaeon]